MIDAVIHEDAGSIGASRDFTKCAKEKIRQGLSDDAEFYAREAVSRLRWRFPRADGEVVTTWSRSSDPSKRRPRFAARPQ